MNRQRDRFGYPYLSREQPYSTGSSILGIEVKYIRPDPATYFLKESLLTQIVPWEVLSVGLHTGLSTFLVERTERREVFYLSI